MNSMKLLLLALVLLNFYYPALFVDGAFTMVSAINIFVSIFLVLRVRKIDFDLIRIIVAIIFIYTSISILHLRVDIDYVKLMLVLFSVLLVSNLFVEYYKKKYILDEVRLIYSKVFFVVILFNSIISLLQLSNIPIVSSFTIEINKLIQRNVLSYNRSSGLMGGFDLNGILISIGIFLAFLLYKRKKEFKYILGICIMLFSLLFSSRTGIVSLIILLTTYNFLTNNWLGFVKKNIKFFFISILLIFTILISTSILAPNWNERLYTFTFEGVTAIFNEGSFKNKSIDDLINSHYKLPNSEFKFFFGDGINNKNRIMGDNSDVAYIQLIFSFGVITTLLLLSFITNALLKLNKWRIKKKASICIVLIINLIIISFKGPYLLNPILLFIIFSFYYIEKVSSTKKSYVVLK